MAFAVAASARTLVTAARVSANWAALILAELDDVELLSSWIEVDERFRRSLDVGAELLCCVETAPGVPG
eukprot:14704817-Heterocapsa_arctica.AAC.1